MHVLIFAALTFFFSPSSRSQSKLYAEPVETEFHYTCIMGQNAFPPSSPFLFLCIISMLSIMHTHGKNARRRRETETYAMCRSHMSPPTLNKMYYKHDCTCTRAGAAQPRDDAFNPVIKKKTNYFIHFDKLMCCVSQLCAPQAQVSAPCTFFCFSSTRYISLS